MKPVKWHFRFNKARKGRKKKSPHPSLIFGKTDDGKKFINAGITHSPRRGHHKNVEIHDPADWSKTSYLRDDVSAHNISNFGPVEKGMRIHPDDRAKIRKAVKRKIK